MTRILHLPITSDAEAFMTAAQASDRALVHLGSPEVEQRGRLERFVVQGVEGELGRLGAAPPGWRYDEGLEAITSDQLYRARLLGNSGLALRFESLNSLADGEGQLGAEDSRTLRRLVALTERVPLQLYLPQRCAELQIIGDPEPISCWLPPSLEPGRVASIEYDDPRCFGELETSDSDPCEAALLPPRVEAFTGVGETPVSPSVELQREPELERGALALQRLLTDVESPIGEMDPDRNPLPSPAVAPASDRGASLASLDATVEDTELARAEPPFDELPVGSEAETVSRPTASTAGATASAEGAAAGLAAPARIEPERIQRCLTWAAQLRSMSGPKVHGSIEKAFITTYLPLSREVAAGLAPPDAAAAARKWGEGFAQSYASAFRQLGSRPRRPMMVKDVIDVGVRWLAQHHARQCQLLLVSAMRFDLGQRLNEELERRLGQGAVCADQCVLWTALPSNADAQQLGEPASARRPSADGRATNPPSIEPLRVGKRGLFKLEHVANELGRHGEPEAARIERFARELADVIVPWMREQPPETLMVVFGDHGFHWQAHASGTSHAQRGGALPEQVLVPASAWLLREPQRARVAPGVH